VHLSSLPASPPAGRSETPWSIFGGQNLDFLVSFQRAPTQEEDALWQRTEWLYGELARADELKAVIGWMVLRGLSEGDAG
jgi:hypothetical protein